jgi:predicted ferric reductase
MALIEVLLYIIIAATPLLIAAVVKPFTDNPFLMEMGRGAALVAFMILMLQPLLAGRFRWIERPFGLDILIRFHRNAAVIGAGLLIAHPLLLTSGEHGIDVIIGTNVPWPVSLGRGALLLLLINVFFSLYRLPRGMKFEKWRTYHDILGPVILLLVFVHSFFQGHDLKDIAPLRGLWMSVF